MTAAHTNLQLANELLRRGWPEDELHRLDRVYLLTARITMRRLRASGEPLLGHLVRTAGLVATVDDTPDMVVAALAHASYMLGDFGDEPVGVTAAKRAVVRDATGGPPEAIVHEYTVRRWQTPYLVDLLARAPGLDATDRAIALIRIANEVEDHLDLGMRYRGITPEELAADDRLPMMADLARRLGWPVLAGALDDAVRREIAAVVPGVLAAHGREHRVLTPVVLDDPSGA